MSRPEWMLRIVGGVGASASAALSPGLFTDEFGRIEFGRLMALITLTGAIWAFLGWLFLPKLKERARAMRMADPAQYGMDVVEVLRHQAVKPIVKQMIDEMYAGRIAHVDDTLASAQHTADLVARLMEDHVPRLENTLSFVNETMVSVQRALSNSQVLVARVEERTKIIFERQEAHYAGIERRHQARRQGDPEPE